MKGITSISIIGTGNVAFHLGNAFFEQGIRIDIVIGRNLSNAQKLAAAWNSNVSDSYTEISSDLVLLCVSDDAINSVIEQINENIPIAYTSGAVDLSGLKRQKNIGVFYPLQTFSKDRSVNLFEVPFLIEASDPELSQNLFDLAWKLSRKVLFASSEERKKYHLAAVWVNNFTNHMVYQAKHYLDGQTLKWEVLLPLLNETIDKLKTMDPFNAQTGPARRNDQQTIDAHKAMLTEQQKVLYTAISKSITDTYFSHD
jgi:predicted short-subunit dehydrogenase-like oxidoreductase (DUF2520 family)